MGNLEKIDHIVYVTENLEASTKYFEKKLGCKVYSGGRHVTKGTHNAIFRIGKQSYFEILAPDPNRDLSLDVNWLGTQNVSIPRITYWCVRPANFYKALALLNQNSKYKFEAQSGSRALADGNMLTWKLGLCNHVSDIDAFPFIIDWEDSTHPSKALIQECELLNISIFHPCPKKITEITKAENIDVSVSKSINARIGITLQCPNGIINIF
jgi:hypothetical protein